MHELSYITRLVNMAAASATENKAKKVESISIQVGQMTGLIPEYLERYYPIACKNTILEGSSIKIEYLHTTLKCDDCGGEYTPNAENNYCCPNCKSIKGKLIHGREFLIKDITIED